MGERNTISSSFTVNTIEDGKDGMVYEIVSSVGSVTIPSDASTATLSASLSFYRRQGTGARETYSCYYAVFRKKGSTYSLIQRSTSKVNSANISFEVTEGNTDAIVACMYDQLATEHSGYLAELEIPVRKNGDTGAAGEDGQDGKDAATLVFEPDVVFVPCDADGSVTDTFSQTSAIYLEINGVRYSPDANTATVDVIADYVDTAWGTNRRSIIVELNGGVEDFEGYIKVTATKTLNGVSYTASGCLTVVARLQGESGLRGNTGPMSYLAGEYDATVNYGALLTDTGCPVVHYNATDEYWYPTEDYIGAGYPPSVANGWKKADNFEMVVTKILFTQFAKLGGFVVSGDYMLSQYGELIDVDGNKLTLTQSTDSDGFTHWKYGNVDAYTYFQGYDPMVEYGILPSIQTRQGVNWQYWNYYETTSDKFYMPVQTTEGNAANTSKLVSLTAGDHYYIYGKDQSGVQHCIMVRVTRYDSTNRRLYGYREKSLGRYVPVLYSATARMFRPVKVVNAATGEEWMSSGKVHVSADGGVTVEGTIRAKNLYRNLCLFSGGVYSNNWYYVNSISDAITENFPNAKVGDYVQSDSEYTGLIHCTYDADIIQMIPVNNSNQYPSDLILPKPQDFQNKVVEINGWSITTSEVDMYVKCVVNNAMAEAVSINNGKFEPASPTSRVTIKTGSTFKFMSMLLSGTWRWVKLNEK